MKTIRFERVRDLTNNPEVDSQLLLKCLMLFSHSPLHLAIIHQQTSVIQQLIHTLVNSQQQNILNTANHLQQVAEAVS